MNIKVEKIIENNRNKVIITTYGFSQSDLDLFENYGEPEINLGGTVDLVPPPGTNEYPDKFQLIKSGSPFIFILDVDVYSEIKCNSWIAYIVSQITSEMESLRTKDTTWIGETILTI